MFCMQPILRPPRGRIRVPGSVLATVLVLALSGCAGGAEIAILSQGAGNFAASGIERTFDGASVKTFSSAAADVDAAVRTALGKMGFEIREAEKTPSRIKVEAGSPQRDIVATLEIVAPSATRLKIEVDEGNFFSGDAATATEIMVQTGLALGISRPAS